VGGGGARKNRRRLESREHAIEDVPADPASRSRQAGGERRTSRVLASTSRVCSGADRLGAQYSRRSTDASACRLVDARFVGERVGTTIALVRGTTIPVAVLTRRLTLVSCVVSIPVVRPNFAARCGRHDDLFRASCSRALADAVDRDLACRAPARMPASELAGGTAEVVVAVTERIASSTPGTWERIIAISARARRVFV